ncbi:MAG: NUDIX hydrolase [Candidatus Rokubacteria bacterium]|nr:NUDIX hydrolase [Candidatus Rokubacteria bacterium]
MTTAMRDEVAALATRLGAPIVRDIPLADVRFDPVGAPDRMAEVCMAIKRPSGKLLLSTKTFYPRGAYRLPTGGIHGDEPILEALLRETREETGLAVAARRFLAMITYLDGEEGPPVFHTFAFLLDETGGTLGSLDPAEQIEGWREIDPADLPDVARRLDALPDGVTPEIPNWSSWGRFRAVVHRVVHEALATT